MDWKQMFDKSRIYPVVLILLMYGVYEWRKKDELTIQKQQQERWLEIQKSRKGLVILQGETMGTYYDIRYYSPDSISYKKQIDSIFRDFSASLSTYINTSDISLFNQNDTVRGVSPYFYSVLNQSQTVFEKTHGAFDPTIMPLVNEWGFGFHERSENLPSQPIIDSLKQLVNLNYVVQTDSFLTKTKSGIMLDFSAVAKGYGVDVISDYLKSQEIKSYKVEVGGEVYCQGKKPNGDSWIIGIEHPKSTTLGEDIQTKIRLENKALASSGNYRNAYKKDGKKYSHTISPITGRPVEHELLSVSVFADNCIMADAYATAFMVMGREQAKKIIEQEKNYIQAYFIYNEENEIKVEYTSDVENYLIDNGNSK